MGEISANSKGEWTAKALRSHMERMARRRGLDPLLPETWLQIIPKFKVFEKYIIIIKIIK
jgi:hypothetical protein